MHARAAKTQSAAMRRACEPAIAVCLIDFQENVSTIAPQQEGVLSQARGCDGKVTSR